MKTTIDLTPLNTDVTREVSPLYLVECLHELSIDYMRLLIGEMEQGDPREEICKRTYDRLFELHRVSGCLIEGMRLAQESGMHQSRKEGDLRMGKAIDKTE